ncbi:hypothetical protein glysoja_015481 [Glycine soja]|nr:hypothetical protein glysoja_015481 [Glycine soja]
MSLVIPSSSAAPLHFSQLETNNFNSHQKFASNFFSPFQNRVGLGCKSRHIRTYLRNELNVLHKYAVRSKGDDFESINDESLDWDDEEEVEDMGYCAPSAESIFSEFSLLLTDKPLEEPETIDKGVIFGEDKLTTSGNSGEDDDDDALIDMDDQLYFPPEQKQIDISKNIRDRVHLEITMNSVYGPGCKGMCLKCGQNFNTGNCNCSKQEVQEKSFGPLGNLKEKMQL